jgi:hypothetical protein
MSKALTKTLKTQTPANLPNFARRLIEANKQKRIDLAKTGAGFRGNLEKTVSYLRWKAGCSTVLEAIDFIAGEIERERIYALYRRLFPKEWKKSRASFTRCGENEYHTEREMEFINLVSDNYFPLSTWLDWSDYRFDHIPIEPVNFDLCCGDFEWQEFRPCLQFGIAAFLYRGGGLYDTDWNEILLNFNLHLEDLPPICHENPPFAELDRRRDDPRVLRFLHLIEFIHHDTGNPFIDTTCCSPMELFEWTEETLEKLKKHYQAIDSYFESMDILDREIERHPLKTFKELISLWNTGQLPATGKRKKAVDKRERQAGLLINILAPLTQIEETELIF